MAVIARIWPRSPSRCSRSRPLMLRSLPQCSTYISSQVSRRPRGGAYQHIALRRKLFALEKRDRGALQAFRGGSDRARNAGRQRTVRRGAGEPRLPAADPRPAPAGYGARHEDLEAERESARAARGGSRADVGLGASEARSRAKRGEHWTCPQGVGQAEREGFEPSVGVLPLHTLSRRAPSTTRSPLRMSNGACITSPGALPGEPRVTLARAGARASRTANPLDGASVAARHMCRGSARL